MGRDEIIMLCCGLLFVLIAGVAGSTARDDVRGLRREATDVTLWDSLTTSVVVALVAGCLAVGAFVALAV